MTHDESVLNYSVDDSQCVVETGVFKKLIIEWLRKKDEYYKLR